MTVSRPRRTGCSKADEQGPVAPNRKADPAKARLASIIRHPFVVNPRLPELSPHTSRDTQPGLFFQDPLDPLRSIEQSTQPLHLRRDAPANCMAPNLPNRSGRTGSLAARQSRIWTSRHGTSSRPEPSYDDELLLHLVGRARESERPWDQFFADAAIEAIVVNYDELDFNFEAIIKRVAEQPDIRELTSTTPPLQREATDLNQSWAERFRRNHPGPVAMLSSD